MGMYVAHRALPTLHTGRVACGGIIRKYPLSGVRNHILCATWVEGRGLIGDHMMRGLWRGEKCLFYQQQGDA